MRYMILLQMMFAIPVFADTSVWKVSLGERQMYIGGTIHVLSNHDYPLPAEYRAAYQKAKIVVLETDLTSVNDLAYQQKVLQRMMYHDNKTLKDDLNSKTYSQLTTFLSKKGIPVEGVQRFKPTMLMMSLLMEELKRLGMAETGVDLHFNQKALADGKSIEHLETLDTQLAVLENMAKGMENEMVLHTLDEIKQLPILMKDMKQAWRKGDLKALEKIGVSQMQNEFPALYQSLLVDRNLAWLPAITKMMQTPEVEMILVGALHLVGEQGILNQLAKMGYRVEKY